MASLKLLKTITVAAIALTPMQAAQADVNAGAYLAGRAASFESDYEAAALYYTRALVRDASNPTLMENAITAYLGLGDVEAALPIARRLMQSGGNNQIANLVLVANDTAKEDWAQIIENLDAGQSVGPLYDGLVRAWALVGMGRMTDALEQFDVVAEGRGVQDFGLYHKALALASVGDFEGANDIFGGAGGQPLGLTRRGVLSHVHVLSQLERHDDALELLTSVFGTTVDPEFLALRAQLEASETIPFDTITTAVDGVAEVHYSIAGALSGEASDGYTLIYSRLASHLRPGHIDALLLSAGILEQLEQFELATAVYDKVPRDDPSYHAAELGRANTLERSGREDAAIEVLTQLSESHGHLPAVHIALGDALRQLERFGEAIPPYARALDLLGEPAPNHWVIYFSRGIANEREDNWPAAEADFKKALELQPDQPQVLNYLGYSYVEMEENLDEALSMIERAVAGQPNSGYITDSLGWVLYRLGRYEEAVGHMERAVELLPIDPIINDHLGDVYWAVGRKREAEFQWLRALSFDPEEQEAERIRQKLEVGLDQVLLDEGAEPLKVANDDG
ncbi:MAG: tetratricopeptide repeat protein [Alphaproteobacteria bacterium]|nr:tetratricopeptide repeat protein [Alphaproteobacteria bacterium]NNF23864.1 tetratricopeptide repeat protein [Paracoccaceae bacterium]